MVGKVGAEMKGVEQGEAADDNHPKGVKAALPRNCQCLFPSASRKLQNVAQDGISAQAKIGKAGTIFASEGMNQV
jgi:hypothetical protein